MKNSAFYFILDSYKHLISHFFILFSGAVYASRHRQPPHGPWDVDRCLKVVDLSVASQLPSIPDLKNCKY